MMKQATRTTMPTPRASPKITPAVIPPTGIFEIKIGPLPENKENNKKTNVLVKYQSG